MTLRAKISKLIALISFRYAQEIKALEKEKHDLEASLSKGHVSMPKKDREPSAAAQVRAAPSEEPVRNLAAVKEPADSSFDSSIDAYVHSLEHALVPSAPAPQHPPTITTVPQDNAGGPLSNKIQQLQLVKQQLEKELHSVARGTLASHGSSAEISSSEAASFAAAAAAAASAEAAVAVRRRQRRRRPSPADLLREKSALQRRLEAYRRERVRIPPTQCAPVAFLPRPARVSCMVSSNHCGAEDRLSC
jgi:hypothetical protein